MALIIRDHTMRDFLVTDMKFTNEKPFLEKIT